jgi:4'-phosphopantetheinyl transferase
LVGCAITATHDIGLDLEEARMPAPLEVAQRYFSGGELERLWALPPAQQHDRFYALWTLKESYIKGCGRGLAMPLDSFTVEPQAQGATKLLIQDPGEDARAWTLRWWRFDRHFGALAVRAASPAPGISLSPGQRIATLAGR